MADGDRTGLALAFQSEHLWRYPKSKEAVETTSPMNRDLPVRHLAEMALFLYVFKTLP